MTTKEVANRLVELCREGKIQDAGKELYSENIISIEPDFAPVPRAEGLKAVVEKGNRFAAMIEATHGSSISDPVVAGKSFSLGWNLDATMKGRGRVNLEEICVYQVENGKIVMEQFFY